MLVAVMSELCSSLVYVLGSVLVWISSPLPLTALTFTLIYAFHCATKDFDFWTKRGVPGPRAVLPWGNEFGVQGIGGTTYSSFDDWMYGQLGSRKFCGYVELRRPVLYVGDLDLISAITVKDIDHFTDKRNRTFSPVFSRMILFLCGREWRQARAAMSPTFTSAKIKGMLSHFLRSATNLSQYIGEARGVRDEIDMKEAFSRYTMDTIASVALGIDCNSFKGENSELTAKASVFFKKPGVYGGVRSLCMMLLPSWLSGLLPDPYTSVRDYFTRITEQTIRQRQQASLARRDFLQLLLEATDKSGNRCFSNGDIVTHCMSFYVAGHDTTANLLTFACCALATVPDCQAQVHRELAVVLARHGGRLTYEAVSELHYLDRVLSETLRMYPALFHLERVCTKAYKLPDTDVHIPVGTLIQIPALPLQRDARFYPEPLRFDPDRFLPEQKETRHPSAFLAFGAGPRKCLARRFALIEAKVALAVVLREHRLEPGANTVPPPLPLDPGATIVSPKPGCYLLKVVPRSAKK